MRLAVPGVGIGIACDPNRFAVNELAADQPVIRDLAGVRDDRSSGPARFGLSRANPLQRDRGLCHADHVIKVHVGLFVSP